MVGYHDGGHHLVNGGEVAFQRDRVIYVGPHFDGPASNRIDGSGCLLTPGFVNAHVHANSMALMRLISDVGRPELAGAAWLETLTPRTGARVNTGEPLELAASYTTAELLSYGTTTFVEAGAPEELLVALASSAAQLGLRMFAGSPIHSAEYWIDDD
ncbi:MAG: amidohydrolase family protein, partial [Chloroflexi bacterium]|nr:amidohydrolase family protein [Chloroflexota bacterium]